MLINRCIKPVLLLAAFLASTAQAGHDLQAMEAAMQRHEYAKLVTQLLPLYRDSRLTDARSLYVLSRACYFHRPTPMQVLRKQTCTGQTGAITLAAAQAGDVQAMLDLTYTLHRPDPTFAHPDLRPDSGEAYRWALLAHDLAADPDHRARARAKVSELFDHIIATTGRQFDSPALSQPRERASRDFLRLAGTANPGLVPGKEGFTSTGQFRALGWIAVPGTDQVNEFKEGNDAIYGLSVRRQGSTVRFDASLNGTDMYRFVQVQALCGDDAKATIIRDSGWLGYESDDSVDPPPYPETGGTVWTEQQAADMPRIVNFACARDFGRIDG